LGRASINKDTRVEKLLLLGLFGGNPKKNRKLVKEKELQKVLLNLLVKWLSKLPEQ